MLTFHIYATVDLTMTLTKAITLPTAFHVNFHKMDIYCFQVHKYIHGN